MFPAGRDPLLLVGARGVQRRAASRVRAVVVRVRRRAGLAGAAGRQAGAPALPGERVAAGRAGDAADSVGGRRGRRAYYVTRYLNTHGCRRIGFNSLLSSLVAGGAGDRQAAPVAAEQHGHGGGLGGAQRVRGAGRALRLAAR